MNELTLSNIFEWIVNFNLLYIIVPFGILIVVIGICITVYENIQAGIEGYKRGCREAEEKYKQKEKEVHEQISQRKW